MHNNKKQDKFNVLLNRLNHLLCANFSQTMLSEPLSFADSQNNNRIGEKERQTVDGCWNTHTHNETKMFTAWLWCGGCCCFTKQKTDTPENKSEHSSKTGRKWTAFSNLFWGEAQTHALLFYVIHKSNEVELGGDSLSSTKLFHRNVQNCDNHSLFIHFK